MRKVLGASEDAALIGRILVEDIDALTKQLIVIEPKEIFEHVVDGLQRLPCLGVDVDEVQIRVAEEYVGADVLQSALEFGEVGGNLATFELVSSV